MLARNVIPKVVEIKAHHIANENATYLEISMCLMSKAGKTEPVLLSVCHTSTPSLNTIQSNNYQFTTAPTSWYALAYDVQVRLSNT